MLLAPVLAATDLFCTYPLGAHHPPPHLQRPQVPDCDLILAHLPSAPPPRGPNTPWPYSPSLPFLPAATIRHGTCVVQLSFHVLQSAPTQEPSTHAWDEAVRASRAAPPIVELYGAMKVVGEKIVSRCVEMGSGWGGIGTGIMGGFSWSIGVTWWDRNTAAADVESIDEMRALLAGQGEVAGGPRGRPWGRFREV